MALSCLMMILWSHGRCWCLNNESMPRRVVDETCAICFIPRPQTFQPAILLGWIQWRSCVVGHLNQLVAGGSLVRMRQHRPASLGYAGVFDVAAEAPESDDWIIPLLELSVAKSESFWTMSTQPVVDVFVEDSIQPAHHSDVRSERKKASVFKSQPDKLVEKPQTQLAIFNGLCIQQPLNQFLIAVPVDCRCKRKMNSEYLLHLPRSEQIASGGICKRRKYTRVVEPGERQSGQ